jgi:threonyl-tRNA synthetase
MPSSSARTASATADHAAPRHRRRLERFIGILIEQHAGALPAWLAPVQVSVLNITDAQADYVANWSKRCRIKGLGCS